MSGTGGGTRHPVDQAHLSEHAAGVQRGQQLLWPTSIDATVDRARDDQEARAARAAFGKDDSTFRQVPAPCKAQQLAQLPPRELAERLECTERLNVDRVTRPALPA